MLMTFPQSGICELAGIIGNVDFRLRIKQFDAHTFSGESDSLQDRFLVLLQILNTHLQDIRVAMNGDCVQAGFI